VTRYKKTKIVRRISGSFTWQSHPSIQLAVVTVHRPSAMIFALVLAAQALVRGFPVAVFLVLAIVLGAVGCLLAARKVSGTGRCCGSR
jgi:type III secretory pathway component EscV